MILLSPGEKIYFTKELADTKVKQIGKSVTLECEISKDGLKVDWYFGNKKLRRGEDFDIAASGKTHTLTIEKATQESVGEYRAEYKTASTSCKLSLAGRLICFRIVLLQKSCSVEITKSSVLCCFNSLATVLYPTFLRWVITCS